MSYLGWLPQEMGEAGYDDTKQASLGHFELLNDRLLKLGGYSKVG